MRDVTYTRQHLVSVLGQLTQKLTSTGPEKNAVISLVWMCPRAPGCGPPPCIATNRLAHYADDFPDAGWKLRPCPLHEPLFPELRERDNRS